METLKEILIWIAVYVILRSLADFLTLKTGVNCYFFFGALATGLAMRITEHCHD